MLSDSNSLVQLQRTRLFLEEGDPHAALPILSTVYTSDTNLHRNLAYLNGWCLILLKQWNAAMQALSPLLGSAFSIEEPLHPVEREQQPICLLLLGEAAFNLTLYTDASRHLRACLKVLHEKRAHLPSVRVKARRLLALTCVKRGLYKTAVQHFEDALRLCRLYDDQTTTPCVYAGLCDAYRLAGNFSQASLAGEEALRLLTLAQKTELRAQMYYTLGRVHFETGDYSAALEQYQTALALATELASSEQMLKSYTALAELNLLQEHLADASDYSDRALALLPNVSDAQECGITYLIAGRIARAMALQASESKRYQLLEEAVLAFKSASNYLVCVTACPYAAEVYHCWAQALEDLGRMQEALERWRIGYEMLSKPPERELCPR